MFDVKKNLDVWIDSSLSARRIRSRIRFSKLWFAGSGAGSGRKWTGSATLICNLIQFGRSEPVGYRYYVTVFYASISINLNCWDNFLSFAKLISWVLQPLLQTFYVAIIFRRFCSVGTVPYRTVLQYRRPFPSRLISNLLHALVQ